MQSVSPFELKICKAVERLRLVLDKARNNLRAASEVQHQYEDKYLLAERLTNIAISSQFNCLTELGFTDEVLATLRGWSQTGELRLRFRAEEFCTFEREAARAKSPANCLTELGLSSRSRGQAT